MKNLLGIYIHVPFCKSKCPYCSFYSVKSSDELKIKYVNKLCTEIISWGNKLNKKVDTIYFGGGTPSLLGADEIIKILKCINENFEVLNPEITLEVNPADYAFIDFEKLSFYGVNRISVGAQTLDDKGLKILGRRHSGKDILNTYSQIKLAKIDNISFDLILGFPGQTKKDIDTFINFYKENRLSHLSAYLLKVEEGTSYSKSSLNFADEDLCSEFYMYVSDKMRSLGYNHYEISNFAISGKESKHNLKYWNLDDYLGIGPSAHSFINGKRFYYENNLKNFLSFSKINYEGMGGAPEEYAMLRLRLSSGLENKVYKEKFGFDIPKEYFKKAERFKNLGLVKIGSDSISLTPKGFLLSNKIIGDLIF